MIAALSIFFFTKSPALGALASCGFWDIDVLIATQKGRPVAMLKALDDDSHVKTRVAQYQALTNEKGINIAKQIVLAKIEGQNQVLAKYRLKMHDSYHRRLQAINIDSLEQGRRKLMALEGDYSDNYFRQIFRLLPEKIRPEYRMSFKAYDGTNNIFNLAYEVLS